MRGALTTLVYVMIAANAAAQGTPSIEGVWKVAQRITPAGNARAQGVAVVQDNPLPSVLIFTKHYYSDIIETGGQPRPAVPPPANRAQLTDAEKIAWYNQWRPFTAHSGTYEIAGSVLIRHPIVAKNIDVMTRGTAIPFDLKFEDANTVWLIPTAEFAGTEPRSKLTRLE
jgi:hypothetical protein